jgi:hypothetical protein
MMGKKNSNSKKEIEEVEDVALQQRQEEGREGGREEEREGGRKEGRKEGRKGKKEGREGGRDLGTSSTAETALSKPGLVSVFLFQDSSVPAHWLRPQSLTPSSIKEAKSHLSFPPLNF